MSAVRCLVLALAVAPLGSLPAQSTAKRVRVRISDYTWIGPAFADAQIQAALASVGPALASVGPALASVGPAMASAQVGIEAAHAALAHTDRYLSGFGVLGSFSSMSTRPPEAWAQQDPADSPYRRARRELNSGSYSRAAELFAQIYAKYPRSSYAGDAYYWQAYALSKRSTDAALRKALDILAEQKVRAKGASTLGDADQLRVRICGQLAQQGDSDCAETITKIAGQAAEGVGKAMEGMTIVVGPVRTPRPPREPTRGRGRNACEIEDDTQSAALNALLNMNGEQALPILKKVLARRDEGSVCLRRKAVFLVSQHESRETERILLDVARTDPDGEVREQAVQWLSQVDSPAAVIALDSILRSASDPALQEKAIFALSQQDRPAARQSLKDFALRPGVSSDLRQKAIFWIGQGDDPDRSGFLKTLYVQLKDMESREKILFSMSQIEGRESQRWLLQVAGDTDENIELRKKALFWAGQSDIPATELFSLYEKMPSREMKEQLIFVYSQRDERAAVDKLLWIAKNEPDRELKKKAIFWLGQSDDPRVPGFLASLLEKPN